jgi:hypothetical protein
VQALRANGGATIGIALNLAPVQPPSSADVEAAHRRDGHLNRWFLDALFRGAYPEDVFALYEPFDVEPDDFATIREPVDFLGVNYYHPERVRSVPANHPWASRSSTAGRTTLRRRADCSSGSSTSTTSRRSGSPRTAFPATRSTTTRASNTCAGISRRSPRRSPTAPTSAGTRLVAAGQSRMGARLRGPVRTRARRLRLATSHAQAQRALVPRLHRGRPACSLSCAGNQPRGRPRSS